jgi:hypothetical protein
MELGELGDHGQKHEDGVNEEMNIVVACVQCRHKKPTEGKD